MTSHDDGISRMLTIKGNIIDTLKQIETKLDSASTKDRKSLLKRKKRFESKLRKIENEIELARRSFFPESQEIPSNIESEGGIQERVQQDNSGETESEIQKLDRAKSDQGEDLESLELKENEYQVESIQITPRIDKVRGFLEFQRTGNETHKKNKIWKNDLTFLLIAVFIISMSLLMFEIALTRIFSVMFSYHYSFLAISLALIGLGMGGVLLHTLSSKFNLKGFSVLTISSILYSLTLVVLTLLMTSLPYSDNMMIYYGLMFIPFLIVGMIFALIFANHAGHSRIIYAIDLIGAGVGCLIVVLFLDRIGGINTVIGIGVIASFGALFFALPSKNRKVLGSAVAVILLVSVLFLQNISYSYFDDVPIGSDPNKDMYRLMSNYDMEVVETRWSAFGRTDLVIDTNESNQDEMFMFIDGSSGTTMYRFNGDIHDPNNTVVRQIPLSFGGYFPYLFPEKDNVLIIGPGGGRDVLIAMMGGAGNITAVEINQDIVDIMKDYSWFNGGLYTDFDNVDVVVDEGRSFIKRSKEKYDIIMLSIPVTKTSGSVSGYSLSENYLFTTDSFKDYFDHLSDEGRLVIVPHDMNEVYKLTSISISMFQEMGISEKEAMKHLVVAGPGGHYGMAGVMFPAFIVKKDPYSVSEAKVRHDLAMRLGYQHVFVPYNSPIMVDAHFYHWENGIMEFETCMAPIQVDMRASTDDSPFFYKFEKGIPPILSSVIGYAFLISLLVLIVPAMYRVSIYKNHFLRVKNKKEKIKKRKDFLSKRKRVGNGREKPETTNNLSISKLVLFFSILGFVFMIIEISLFQKFILFLGHPTLSLSVLLFSLLISSGLGSLFSNHFRKESLPKRVSTISLMITGIIIVYVIVLQWIFNALLGLDILLRTMISGLLLFPLGFLMGIPFPSGISLMKKSYKKDIPWMWGINGTFSVMGSAFAIMIAMTSGFTGGLIVGALGYFIVFMMFRK
jgi:predicted membrane-bound spermidine synthase